MPMKLSSDTYEKEVVRAIRKYNRNKIAELLTICEGIHGLNKIDVFTSEDKKKFYEGALNFEQQCSLVGSIEGLKELLKELKSCCDGSVEKQGQNEIDAEGISRIALCKEKIEKVKSKLIECQNEDYFVGKGLSKKKIDIKGRVSKDQLIKRNCELEEELKKVKKNNLEPKKIESSSRESVLEKRISKLKEINDVLEQKYEELKKDIKEIKKTASEKESLLNQSLSKVIDINSNLEIELKNEQYKILKLEENIHQLQQLDSRVDDKKVQSYLKEVQDGNELLKYLKTIKSLIVEKENKSKKSEIVVINGSECECQRNAYDLIVTRQYSEGVTEDLNIQLPDGSEVQTNISLSNGFCYVIKNCGCAIAGSRKKRGNLIIKVEKRLN